VSAPRIAILTDPRDPLSDRLTRLSGGIPVASARSLVRVRPALVHVRLPVDSLAGAAFWSTVAGARAVLVTPLGQPRRLPWWERRFHRFVLPSQEAARAWRSVGIALGRIVVVEPGDDESEAEALRSVYTESLSMG
jgi:hypothetical protein